MAELILGKDLMVFFRRVKDKRRKTLLKYVSKQNTLSTLKKRSKPPKPKTA